MFDIQGRSDGPTLLVTGGMDGDEYAGIEASRKLAHLYENGNFAGRLIIFPLVNVPGFAAGTSLNPLDGRYPKYIFPGHTHGSPTERLIAHIAIYAQQADAWYDAHGGAHNERMHPFIWTYGGIWTYRGWGHKTQRIIQEYHALIADDIVHEHANFFSKAGYLARRGCAYLIAESGELGERRTEDIERHIAWIKKLMIAMRMLPYPSKTSSISVSPKQNKMRHVAYVYAPRDGVWTPEANLQDLIDPQRPLGCFVASHQTIDQLLYPNALGHLLWWRIHGSVKKNDILAAIGS